MRPGPHPKGELMRRRILNASAKVFLEYGYNGASSKMVARLAGVSNGSPFFLYGNKEGVLLELVKLVYAEQFRMTDELIGKDADLLLFYAVETALQMHIAELSDALRDLYVMAYTLPSTAEYIHQSTKTKLAEIYAKQFPNADVEEFYELEIASSGVLRNYMVKPCNEQMPMARKLQCYLSCCFRIYKVPEAQYQPVIDRVLTMDLRPAAQQTVDRIMALVDDGFSSAMNESRRKAFKD